MKLELDHRSEDIYPLVETWNITFAKKNTIPVNIHSQERRNFLRFYQALNQVLVNKGKPTYVPPNKSSLDSCDIEDIHRAHVVIFANNEPKFVPVSDFQYTSCAPANIFGAEETLIAYLQKINKHLNGKLRITNPKLAEQMFGGWLIEFDEIEYINKAYHRHRLFSCPRALDVYSNSIPADRFIQLLEIYPIKEYPNFEKYFEFLELSHLIAPPTPKNQLSLSL